MIRVAVVGGGKMGGHHARVFARCARFVGAYDQVGERAARLVQAYGGTRFDSLESAIASADLVIVATPTSCHFDVARAVIAEGRHVLVEKPLCATEKEASALCDLAARQGVELLVGHSERFNPVVRAVADAVRGEPIIELVTRRVLAHASRLEEPCLNLAVHDIDLAAFLSGGSVEVEHAASSGSTIDIALRMQCGRAILTVGYAPHASRHLSIRTARQAHTGDLAMPHCVDAEPLALQADAAISALRGHASAIARGREGARAVFLAHRAALAVADARISAAE